MMTNFTFGEGVADGAYLWFGEFFENITPESFYGYFDLSDGQHGILDSIFFGGGGVDFEVLNVASEVEFSMNPVRVADGVNVLGELRVFVRLEIDTFFENITFAFFGVFLAIEDEGFGGILEAGAHEGFFGEVLDVLNGGKVLTSVNHFQLM